MYYLGVFVYFILAVSAGIVKRVTYSYRDDYTYHPETDTFYKMHIEMEGWHRAKAVCEEEKAKLLGQGAADIVIGHSMMKRFPFLSDKVYISNAGKIHKSDYNIEQKYSWTSDANDCEGELCEVNVRAWEECNVLDLRGELSSTRCFRTLPFICKVARSDLRYNEQCKVFDSDFKYNATLASCYKVKGTAFSWGEAYSGCRNEGAHLVVINSAAEAQHLQILSKDLEVRRATYQWFFHIGFRSHPERGDNVYRTIFNETLSQAGYDAWSPGEPNNHNDDEHCGSFFSIDGKLNDISCSSQHGYICEKEINNTS